MKILSATQLRKWDSYSINHQNSSSAQLMEKAASGIASWLLDNLPNPKQQRIHFICGPGNNGGDGLLAAKILQEQGFFAKVWIFKKQGSVDYNRELAKHKASTLGNIEQLSKLASVPADKLVIVDAIFGNGLNKPVSGVFGKVIARLNAITGYKIAIDMPSGLFADAASPSGDIFKADVTLTIEIPKLAFFMPESYEYVGKWQIIKIGLSQEYQEKIAGQAVYLTKENIPKLKNRKKFSHKGDYGHLLVVGGSSGQFGCLALAAKAALKGGTGLVTVATISELINHIIGLLPEVMATPTEKFTDSDDLTFLKKYNALAIGPGLGVNNASYELLKALLQEYQKTSLQPKNTTNDDNPLPAQRLLLDADALNLLGQHQDLKKMLSPDCVLTPHPKEFSRLAGRTFKNSWEELTFAKEFAKKYKLVLVLKRAHSLIFYGEDSFFISSTGNPGMATAGSGDVLTGIIGGFLAQGYSPLAASLLGVFSHGLAGDIFGKQFARKLALESLIASDLIDHLAAALLELRLL